MATASVNGVRLFYEVSGDASCPLVMVHGSWGSHANWAGVVPGLASTFTVVTYDRRGHSDSERLDEQGSVRQDVTDLAALIEHLDVAPAWVVGNSFGASVALRMALSHPDLVRGVVAHEPPLLSLLMDGAAPDDAGEGDNPLGGVLELIESGEHAAAAELFVDTVALGPGSWAQLPPDMKATFVYNAPTFLDEARDPEQLFFDLAWVDGFHRPTLLTRGDTSPPPFEPIVTRLAAAIPQAKLVVLEGAGHIPHVTHSEIYIETVRTFVNRHEAGS